MSSIKKYIIFMICPTLLSIIPFQIDADTILFNASQNKQVERKLPLKQPSVKETKETPALVKEAPDNTTESSLQCVPIQFKRGYISDAISDRISPEEVKCYSLGVAINQTVELYLVSRFQNTVFSIKDVIDAQDKISFVATRKNYQIQVFQMMRSAREDYYTMMVVIRNK